MPNIISKIKLNDLTYDIKDAAAIKKLEYSTINKALKVYTNTSKSADSLVDTIDLSTLVADSVASTVVASGAYVFYPQNAVTNYDNFSIQVKGNNGAAIDFIVDKGQSGNSQEIDVRLPMDKSGTIALLSDVTVALDEAATKYTKPQDGIPKSDLEQSVLISLEKADSALQTESDPTVPTHVKNITLLNITDWNNKVSNVLADWNATSGLSAILNKPTDLASTSYVDTKVAGIVNSAPEALDTLQELALALGNDANFATTVSTLIGSKYTKPTSGIPKSDLSNGVQSSLNLADSAVLPADISDMAKKSELTITAGSSSDKKTIQLKSGTSLEVLVAHQDISGKADKSNVYTKTEIDNKLPVIVTFVKDSSDNITCDKTIKEINLIQAEGREIIAHLYTPSKPSSVSDNYDIGYITNAYPGTNHLHICKFTFADYSITGFGPTLGLSTPDMWTIEDFSYATTSAVETITDRLDNTNYLIYTSYNSQTETLELTY